MVAPEGIGTKGGTPPGALMYTVPFVVADHSEEVEPLEKVALRASVTGEGLAGCMCP